MEIRITTKQILLFLNILSWIIFVGVCIEAGGPISGMALTFQPCMPMTKAIS